MIPPHCGVSDMRVMVYILYATFLAGAPLASITTPKRYEMFLCFKFDNATHVHRFKIPLLGSNQN